MLDDLRWLLSLIAALLTVSSEGVSASASSIKTLLDINSNRPNVFKGYPVPTRETLLAISPFRESALRDRRQRGTRPGDCAKDLLDMKRGFKEIYPDAPRDASLSWTIHIAMIHFPHLYLCRTRNQINKSLDEIERINYRVTPIAQRIYIGDYDFEAYNRLPRAVQILEHESRDLIWMSYRGFRPAMLELLRLDDRSRIVRLTWRFKCYLLMSVIDAKLEDPLIDKLVPEITRTLTDPTIKELKARAKTRKWPRSERMVID